MNTFDADTWGHDTREDGRKIVVVRALFPDEGFEEPFRDLLEAMRGWGTVHGTVPGDRWARKLYLHIDESDVMFLFWSTAAKKSKGVEEEWRYALRVKGDFFGG